MKAAYLTSDLLSSYTGGIKGYVDEEVVLKGLDACKFYVKNELWYISKEPKETREEHAEFILQNLPESIKTNTDSFKEIVRIFIFNLEMPVEFLLNHKDCFSCSEIEESSFYSNKDYEAAKLVKRMN